jgi:hypothetical protein
VKVEGVPLIDVQARWGYSEIVNSAGSHNYDNGYGIAELRAKRASGVPFDQLSEAERYNLAFQNACIRPKLLVYLIGTDLFDVVQMNREALAGALVPPNIWFPKSAGRFVRFEEYIETRGDNPTDPRNSLTQGYKDPIDPVTFGRSYHFPILIDGFHRAAFFWRFSPADAKLLAYVPRSLKK